MKQKILFPALFFLGVLLHAQDTETARGIIQDLCSKEMFGRGYLKGGDSLAAQYISHKFAEIGLEKYSPDYFQKFTFPVNTFPGECDVSVDGLTLVPGYDYITDPASKSILGDFEIAWFDKNISTQPNLYRSFKWGIKKKVICVDIATFNGEKNERLEKVLNNKFKAKCIVIVVDGKLTWSAEQKQNKYAGLVMKWGKLNRSAKRMKLNIIAVLEKAHRSQNVIGYVKGSKYPDSVIVFTAHYDHLGGLGRYIYFPGANDNASGIAMLLDLARYYHMKPPRYTVMFIAFAGEEPGLVGSKYYVSNPVIPLKNISFLINMDLLGTGENGATIVNGSVFLYEFALLNDINKENKLLKTINVRGKAANSDHYFFTEAGVRSFFIYLLGDYTFYHDVYDTSEAVKLKKYSETWVLLTQFANALMNSR